MIQKLTIKNYKGFNGEVSVELLLLSLITGSEGKTSILNALRLLREELHVIIPNLTSANGVTGIYYNEGWVEDFETPDERLDWFHIGHSHY